MPVSYSTHTVASTASGSALQFAVNYPYILRSHVKVYYGKDILAGTHTSLLVDGADYNWTTDTQITLTAAPSTQSTLTIIRETPTSAQLVPWQDGSNLIAEDLNKSDKQNLYAVQEQDDKTALASSKALSAETTANTATTTANNATATANSATTDAATAISTANTANTNATAAQVAATSAQSSAAAAQASAASAQTSATNAQTDASAAQTAATNAQTSATAAQTSAASAQTSATAAAADAATAISTANTASTNATTALNNSRQSDGQGGFTTAISLANTANTTANSTISTASTASTNASNAVTTANAANATANAAAAAVANAAFYSPIAALANLPSSPADQDRVEVVNSTGVESSSAVSGVPSGFVGSTNLTVRLQYSSSSTKWEWQQYFAADPENRYATNYLPVIKGDGTLSGQVGKITLNCSNNNHGVSLSSPPHSANATYNLTLPTGLPSTTGQALISDTNGNLSFADPAPPDLSITSAKLADNSVTNLKLVNGSVTDSKLAAGSVTSSKLANDITIAGNLTVNGTTTTVNSTTLSVDDKNIELGSVSTPSDTTADGGGITIKGATDKTLTWENSTSSWTFNQPVVISPGGTEALRFSTLGQVGIAGANYGTAGQVLMSGGASAAPAWANVEASPSFQATASGAISNGDTLTLNSDGTVSAISGGGSSPTLGTDYNFNGATNTYYVKSVYDTNQNKLIITYYNNNQSGQMYSVIGTISGTSISWTDHKSMGSNIYMNKASMAFDSNVNKIVVVSKDGQYGGFKYQVGTCDSTPQITWSGWQSIHSNNVDVTTLSFDSYNNKMVIAYKDEADNNYGNAKVGTVSSSGNSMSFGSAQTFATTDVNHLSSCFDSNSNKTVITYADDGGSRKGHAVVATVSGTSISYGTPVQYSTGADQTESQACVFDPSTNKVVIFYRNDSQNYYGYAVVGTVSGTSISFGTPVVFHAGAVGHLAASYQPTGNRVIVAFKNYLDTNDGYYRSARVSGTTLVFDSVVEFINQDTEMHTLAYDPDTQQNIVSYRNDSSYFKEGQSKVFTAESQFTNLTSTSYVGIADAAYSNGQTVNVQTFGSVDDAQSGLTPGQVYFINQNTGNLQTTAGAPSVQAGIAIAANKLLIK